MKKALYIIAALVVLIVIAGLIAPRSYTVERDIVIDRPLDQVFGYVKSLEAQNQWSKWGTLDPEMKTEYYGQDCTVGFVSAWEGNSDVGRGEQQIMGIIEGERVDFELRFIEPWESVSQAWLSTTAINENQTNVQWGFTGRLGFPVNLMMLVLNFRKSIGEDLEEGLQNLKAIMES